MPAPEHTLSIKMHDPSEHHAAAHRLFAAAVRRTADQRARVERLRLGGLATQRSEQVLNLFERTLAIMEDHRAKLDEEMTQWRTRGQRRQQRGRGFS